MKVELHPDDLRPEFQTEGGGITINTTQVTYDHLNEVAQAAARLVKRTGERAVFYAWDRKSYSPIIVPDPEPDTPIITDTAMVGVAYDLEEGRTEEGGVKESIAYKHIRLSWRVGDHEFKDRFDTGDAELDFMLACTAASDLGVSHFMQSSSIDHFVMDGGEDFTKVPKLSEDQLQRGKLVIHAWRRKRKVPRRPVQPDTLEV